MFRKLMIPFMTALFCFAGLGLAPTASAADPVYSSVPLPTLSVGSSGKVVSSWEVIYNTDIALSWHLNGLKVDGYFGVDDQWTAIDLQRRFGLNDDGIVGPKTWSFTDDRGAGYNIVGTHAMPQGEPRISYFDPWAAYTWAALYNFWWAGPHDDTPAIYDGSFDVADQWEAKAYQDLFLGGGNGIIGPLTWHALFYGVN